MLKKFFKIKSKQDEFWDGIMESDLDKIKKSLKGNLFSKSADINALDDKGNPAFFYAYFHPEVFNFLVDNGADPYVVMRSNECPDMEISILQMCITLDKTEQVKKLCSVMELDKVENHGTLLSMAAFLGRVDTVEVLLDWGISPNVSRGDGKTIMFTAVEMCKPDVLKILAARGGDLHQTLEDGRTLMNVIGSMTNETERQVPIAQYLYDKGLAIDNQNNAGETPLMRAASDNNIELMRFFVEHGADVDMFNKDGMTALMYAIKSVNPEAVTYLLQQNVDVNFENNNGETALTIANKIYENPQPNEEKSSQKDADAEEKRNKEIQNIKDNTWNIMQLLREHGAVWGSGIVTDRNNNDVEREMSYKPADLSKTINEKEASELVSLTENDKFFLQRLARTGLILDALQKMSYDQSVCICKKIYTQMPVDVRQKAQDIVRDKRARADN